jgi:hypothetical protein
MLHWHWFAPVVEPGAGRPGSPDEPRAPGSGPALHAHLGDWPAPDWTGPPLVRPEARGRWLDLLALGLIGSSPLNAADRIAEVDPGPHLSSTSSTGGDGPRAGLLSLVHRWNC